MSFVKYIACDGCGERIDKKSEYIEITMDQKDVDGDSITTRELIEAFNWSSTSTIHHTRNQVVWHFHGKECLLCFMKNYHDQKSDDQ